jgi:hypothetical protein
MPTDKLPQAEPIILPEAPDLDCLPAAPDLEELERSAPAPVELPEAPDLEELEKSAPAPGNLHAIVSFTEEMREMGQKHYRPPATSLFVEIPEKALEILDELFVAAAVARAACRNASPAIHASIYESCWDSNQIGCTFDLHRFAQARVTDVSSYIATIVVDGWRRDPDIRAGHIEVKFTGSINRSGVDAALEMARREVRHV